MKVLAALLMVTLALPIYATGDKQIPKPVVRTQTVFVDRSDHSREWTAALIGAGVTYWILHRRNRRAAPPEQVRVVPPAPVCEDRTVEIERRVALACGK